ncbi:hypothetical protein FB459_1395 [Yimella lutea]|uniref:DUF6318 domain-containing protein n=1 Tax=Yimella lutea TaxID=587872 RepID=A0A542EF44_9MICO|nr:DUF6318 family protein [Yimella lutea]TQJ13957.1 hypothetical protein FB459_1395 [Yimella lutea]
MQGLFLLLEVLMTARFMRTVAPLVAASAVCGLMVGCGGGSPAAKSSPPSSTTTSAASPTTSKTTSTSATPTSQTSNATYAGAPGVPEAAKHKTDAGAIAFAKHYLETVNKVGQKPNAGVLEPLATPSCKTCKNQQRTVNKLIAEKATFSGPQFVIGDAAKLPGPQTVVGVVVGQPATQIVNGTGTVLHESEDEGRAQAVLELRWASGWRVAELKHAAA